MGSLIIAVISLLGLLLLLVFLGLLFLLLFFLLLGLLLLGLLSSLSIALLLLLVSGIIFLRGLLGLGLLLSGRCLATHFRDNLFDSSALRVVTEEKLPGLGSVVGHAAELVKLTLLLEVSLLLAEGAELPLLFVDVTVHDDTLCACHNAVIASCNCRGGHLSNGKGDSLTLSGDKGNLVADLDVAFITEDTGEHELGAIADSVDGGVLDYNTLVADKENFEGHNNAAEIFFVVVLLEVPLSILDVVHRHHGLVLFEGTGAHTTQLLHMSTATEEVANMDTKRTHISASLTADPEDAHVALVVVLNQLSLVDSPNTKLLLDGGDKRRPLEARALKGVERFLKLLDLVEALMELDDGNVLFTSGLLCLDKPCCVVNADNEAASDLRVKGARVASLVDLEDFLDPGDNLVR